MNYQEAYEAILAILDQVDDASLPDGKVEHRTDSTIVWFGGTGRHLGSARRNGALDPSIYHEDAARDVEDYATPGPHGEWPLDPVRPQSTDLDPDHA